MTTEKDSFEGWAILELMGHRRLAGYLRQQEVAGAAFIRIDVPQPEGPDPAITQFYTPAAVYCITPTTETMARAVARTSEPAPVQRWELPEAHALSVEADEADARQSPAPASSEYVLEDPAYCWQCQGIAACPHLTEMCGTCGHPVSGHGTGGCMATRTLPDDSLENKYCQCTLTFNAQPIPLPIEVAAEVTAAAAAPDPQPVESGPDDIPF